MDIDNATAVTRGLQGWCYAVSFREHFAVATAALVVGLESQVPSIYRRQYPVLLEKYKFDEDAVEFFDLHITSDEIHGERGYQIVLKYADTPALQQRCLQLVRHGAEMRYSYTKALYDTYVAPEAPVANPEPALA
jgi:pyrroloquinoline-quinone synthase